MVGKLKDEELKVIKGAIGAKAGFVIGTQLDLLKSKFLAIPVIIGGATVAFLSGKKTDDKINKVLNLVKKGEMNKATYVFEKMAVLNFFRIVKTIKGTHRNTIKAFEKSIEVTKHPNEAIHKLQKSQVIEPLSKKFSLEVKDVGTKYILKEKNLKVKKILPQVNEGQSFLQLWHNSKALPTKSFAGKSFVKVGIGALGVATVALIGLSLAPKPRKTATTITKLDGTNTTIKMKKLINLPRKK